MGLLGITYGADLRTWSNPTPLFPLFLLRACCVNTSYAPIRSVQNPWTALSSPAIAISSLFAPHSELVKFNRQVSARFLVYLPPMVR